jgi:hypothetical protein
MDGSNNQVLLVILSALEVWVVLLRPNRFLTPTFRFANDCCHFDCRGQRPIFHSCLLTSLFDYCMLTLVGLFDYCMLTLVAAQIKSLRSESTALDAHIVNGNPADLTNLTRPACLATAGHKVTGSLVRSSWWCKNIPKSQGFICCR